MLRPKDGNRSALMGRRRGPVPTPVLQTTPFPPSAGRQAIPTRSNGNGHANETREMISPRLLLQLLQEVRMLREDIAEMRSVLTSMSGETEIEPEEALADKPEPRVEPEPEVAAPTSRRSAAK